MITTLKFELTSDGETVSTFQIRGSQAEKQALVAIMDYVMPNPCLALHVLSSEAKKHGIDKAT